MPSYTSVPSQSPMSFAPPQLAMGTSMPSQSPMSSILSQLALGGSASSQSSSVQPPQGTAEGSDVPPGQPLPSSAIQNISRNARSKGIDNCCGLYIHVYFRITPIENERRFINLIAV